MSKTSERAFKILSSLEGFLGFPLQLAASPHTAPARNSAAHLLNLHFFCNKSFSISFRGNGKSWKRLTLAIVFENRRLMETDFPSSFLADEGLVFAFAVAYWLNEDS